MPTYSYICDKCQKDFELFFYIKDYQESPICPQCKKTKTHRLYVKDIATQRASVRKSDSELKTIGDLANRNRDRMSKDEMISLHKKHNEYKEDTTHQKSLPKGMKRIKKQPKIKWT